MKFSWLVVLVVVVGFAVPRTSQAQVSVFGEVTASDLNDGKGADWLYGGTIGVVADGPTLFKRMILSADIQTGYVEMSSNGERLASALVGPRFTFPLKKMKLNPYGEFLVGFGRYRNVSTSTATVTSLSTTDDLFGIGAGVAKQLNSRLDAVVEYDYTQYGANDGEFNPKSFSGGVVFHFIKR